MNKEVSKLYRKRLAVTAILLFAVALLFVLCIFVGSSDMSIGECINALLKRGSAAQNRIVWNIRMPRAIAALIAGAGLSVSGLVMQTVLDNPMASPATLGVTNAAAFGANLSVIAFAGGFFSAAALSVSLMAFAFAALSVLLILGICRLRSFSPGAVVLAGIAAGSVWSAGTSFLQFYATDTGISASVVWSFGDLGRATYRSDLIMLTVVVSGLLFFLLSAWKYNALLSGDAAAKSLGINVSRLRFFTLLAASLITAVCVSVVGVIGFVGIICPHTVKKLLGHDHRFSVPASALTGSGLLLLADALSRSIAGGSALPAGAVTTLLGAPFFIAVIFSEKGREQC